MRYVTLLLSALLFASGCASSKKAETVQPEDKGDGIVSSGMKAGGQVVRETRDGFGDAAMAPLEDMNLKRKKIPEEIKSFISPYDPVTDMSCDGITTEVERLDTVLAKDFDLQIQELIQNEGKKSKGSMASKASDLALDTIASEASGFIPFRGLVRQASGANAHERKVDQAFQRAYLRRSFLKGIGLGKGCEVPASPIPYDLQDLDPKMAPIAYRADLPEETED